MSAIFISHSSKDHAAAAELKARLDAQGHKGVFLDFDPDDGIHAGRDWEQVIYEQLRVSAAVIVLCSPASMRSRWCFAEITQARAGGKRLFLVKIADCAIDGLLTDLQVIDITADREDGYRRLASGLKDAGLDPLDDFDWDGSRPPYPGLVSFEEKDAAVYFGRAGEIQDGLDRLNSLRRIETTGFAMVLGASGSGKSSLARAGLVPRLRKDPGGWIVTDPFRPRQDPFQGLSFAISAEFTKLGRPRDWQEIHKDLTVGPPALDPGNPLRAIANELRGNSEARALIVVDQFEELLAPEAQAVSGPFLRLLREAAAGADSPVVVLGTMRSDFLGAFQSHPQLSGLRFQAIPLGPMSAEGIRQVIEGPAEKGGLKFEPGLVETIAEDTAHGDALPLLAFALRELFDRFGTGDREIARDEYVVGLGGL